MKPRDLNIPSGFGQPEKPGKDLLSRKPSLVKQLEKDLTGKVIPEKPSRPAADKVIYVGPDDPDETDRIEIGKGGGKRKAVPGTIKLRIPKDRGRIP